MTTIETLEQFTKRMSKQSHLEIFTVGQRHQNISREVFKFENQTCFRESKNFSIYMSEKMNPLMKAMKLAYNEPSSYWYTSYASYGLERAEHIAKHYKACRIEDEPYALEENSWFYYIFEGDDDFGQLMKFVYDKETGQFESLFGKEPELFEDCIDNEKVEMI